MSQSRIKEILDGLYFDARTQRGKGTAFERLVRQFLLTDPRHAERFDEVWMWSDWPERGARPDRYLVDLIARITTASVRTQAIITSLPPLDVFPAGNHTK